MVESFHVGMVAWARHFRKGYGVLMSFESILNHFFFRKERIRNMEYLFFCRFLVWCLCIQDNIGLVEESSFEQNEDLFDLTDC